MTTRQIVRPDAPPLPAPAPDAINTFPHFPPRSDMMNVLFLHRLAWLPALHRQLSAVHPNPLVISEMPLAWRHNQGSGMLIPDLMIAFDVDSDRIISRRGYAIDEWGKPPDFVLEIASPTTASNDEGNKRAGYASYGVPEYWRFDNEWGRHYATGLAGDRLDDSAYRPITIHRYADGMHWGHSAVLNLDLCWEHGQLRWYDPTARRYLDTFDQEAEGRIAERTGRIIAEGERDTERERRRAERERRIASEAEVQRLQTEIRRLQDE